MSKSLPRIGLAILLIFTVWAPALAQDAPPAPAGPAATDPGAFLDQDYAAMLASAGTAYQEQRYEDAIQGYLEYLKWNTDDAQSIYNLACCYGLQGDAEQAALYLRRANKAGFHAIDWAEQDPDLALVKDQPVFAAALAELKAAEAAGADKLGEMRLYEGRALLYCRLHLPVDFDPAQEYKLVVGLHGYGASPDNFTKLWERFPRQDFIFAVPQAPYPHIEGTEPGYSWAVEHPWHCEADGQAIDAATPAGLGLTEEYVLSIVAQLKQEYKISQVYLMGFSQGCGMTYIFGLRHPDVFSGLMCFSGWFDKELLTPEVLAAANGVRVFIAHGTQDTILEPALGEEARDILQAAGYDVTFFSFDGPHRVPPEAAQAADEWLHAP